MNGTVSLNNAQAMSGSGFVINGGNVDNTSGSAVTISGGSPILVNNDFAFLGTNDLNLGTGTVTFGNQANITVNAGNLTFGGHLDDQGNGDNLEKYGAGALVLRGTGTTFGGLVDIYQGSLVLAAPSNAIPTETQVNLGDGNTGSATLVLGDATSGPVTQVLAGLMVNGTGTQNAVIGGNDSVSTLILNVPGSSDVNEYDGLLGLGTGNTNVVPANALALTKIGSGTLILTGDNTYLGGTNLKSGTIQISNATNLGADTGSVSQGVVLGNASVASMLEITNGGL